MIEIDLRSRVHCPKLFSRLVWQSLFNLYRFGGGDLGRMDSFLCDYDMLQKLFDGTANFALHLESGGAVVTYWRFDGLFTEFQKSLEPGFVNYRIVYYRYAQRVTIEMVEP